MSIEAPETLNGQAPAEPRPVRFGPAKGNIFSPEWAEWMLTEWRTAEVSGAKPPKFSDVLQRAAVHFMMEGK
jgi:hypothetical protein